MNDLIEQLQKLNTAIAQINKGVTDIQFELDEIIRVQNAGFKVESQEEKDGERQFEMERGN